MDWRDQPSSVRPGEELDSKALTQYLSASFPSFTPPIEITQFPGGFSNLTYQINWGDQQWILRRPPHGANIKSGHDMGREFKILSGLASIYDKTPPPLAYCTNEAILGAPFYLMERVDGVILRAGMPTAMIPSPETMTKIAKQLINTLAELHSIDYNAAGLDDLGRPEGYIERQITGWQRRYTRAKTDTIPSMDRVGAWLESHMPAAGMPALIHNDFKYDNLVLAQDDWTKVIGILDWEMATLGDPLMDLGTTLAYWVDPNDPPAMQALQLSPTTLPGNPTRSQLANWYSEMTGRSLDDLVFYYVYGLFKVAVIVQQIYYRYKKGYTKDQRFASLIHAVHACSQTAEKSIESGKIDGFSG